jgi:hypothetical protein
MQVENNILYKSHKSGSTNLQKKKKKEEKNDGT